MILLLNVIKQAAIQAVNANRPVILVQGEVMKIKPLTIKVDQKAELPEQFFALTHLVKDYYVDVSVSHVTENRGGGGGYAAYESHNHDYKGRKKILVHNGLRVGECVHLLQVQGGQKYIVLDRVHDPIIEGEWL